MIIHPTADQGLIRKLNTAVVLDTLRRFAPLSRAELAGHTGLNRSTVSSIVNSLIEEGFVQETDLQSARIGRPGMQLMINPKGGFAVGIEIGVDFISVIATDFTAQVIHRERMGACPDQTVIAGGDQITILGCAAGMAQKAIELGQAQGLRPLGIGIGVPGLVDLHQGKLVFAPNLQWHNVPLRLILSQQFNLPVFVENEANAAALGEYYFGAARGSNNFIYLSAGIGLGGGIMIDGKLFRGATGYASEIGHMTIDSNDEMCGCGKRGCLETHVGSRAVLQRVRRTLASGVPSMLYELAEGDPSALTFENIVQAADREDAVALAALQVVGEQLGVGVSNLVNIFNPDMIVLGGILNLASRYLLPIVSKSLMQNALQPASEIVRVLPSAHGQDACVMGAAALVLEFILNEPSF
jgi:glucokinase-like ROK family protein